MVLKRIGPLSLAKMMGAVYGVLGLIIGGVVALLSLIGAGFAQANDVEGGLGVLIGVGAVVFFPLVYGLMGFLAGAIGAGLYNLFAGVVGGISLDLE